MGRGSGQPIQWTEVVGPRNSFHSRAMPTQLSPFHARVGAARGFGWLGVGAICWGVLLGFNRLPVHDMQPHNMHTKCKACASHAQAQPRKRAKIKVMHKRQPMPKQAHASHADNMLMLNLQTMQGTRSCINVIPCWIIQFWIQGLGLRFNRQQQNNTRCRPRCSSPGTSGPK